MVESPPLGYVLKRTEDLFIRRMDAALSVVNLTMPQFAALHSLQENPEGLSNADLARHSFVSPQAMHGVLKLLEARGLVSRPATAIAGRVRRARLTADGARSYKKAQRHAHATAEEAFAGLSTAKRNEFRRTLNVVISTLEEMS